MQAGVKEHVGDGLLVDSCLLRQGGVGYAQQAPAGLLPAQRGNRAHGASESRQLVARDIPHGGQVVSAAKSQIHIRPLHAHGLDFRHPVDLLPIAEFQHQAIEFFGQKLDLGVCPGLDAGFINRQD